MAQAIVSIVLGRLTDLLSEEAQVLHGVKNEIEQVVAELMRIKTFLPDADSRIDEEKVRIFVAEVRDLAYDAEHVVESFLVKASSGERKRRKQENKYRKKFKDIQRKIFVISDCFGDYNIRSTLESPESSNSTQGTPGKLKRFHSFTTVEPYIFVGFQEDVDRLVGHLVNESDKSYPLISICGMGGLGKTTLAQKIYNHSTIKTYFPGLAWVTISQKWQTKQVLQRILICLVPEKRNEILTFHNDELVENMLQIQQSKKCLIVLDDIWSIDAWDSLKAAFPTKKSRSRLMLTSRNVNVAEHASPNGFIHRPELLSPDQSWELLRLRALPRGGDCLDIIRDVKRMEELGREMVGNCGGLPLAIVSLGGILVTKPSLIEWEKVYNDSLSSLMFGKGFGENYQNIAARDFKRMEKLGREMVRNCAGLPLAIVILGGILVTKPSMIEWQKVYNDSLSPLKKGKGLKENYQKELLHVLVWSYNDLPPQLKSCFLYLGKYSEDESIDAETLYQLWIAEGMVLSSDKREGETMMQVAESYMGELVLKSMVQVRFDDSESSLTKFKSCCLPGPMRDLSISQGKVEDFFEAIDLQKGNKFHLFMFANTRRLVVNCDPTYRTIKDNSYIVKEPNHQRYRSMLLENGDKCRSLTPVLGLHFANFRLLRVLALEDVSLDRQTVSGNRFGTSIGRVIGSLIYLRYLSARKSNLMILPWIQKLVLLQTLKLDVESPPKSIITLGKLSHLRHLYLPNWGSKRLEKKVKLRLNGLSRLETFETFNPEFSEIKDLPELTSLGRLRVEVDNDCDNVEEMMKYLATLALSSTSSHRYWALVFKITDEGLLNDGNIIRQLFWNDNFNLEELTINGRLPAELGELFEQKQQRLNTHIDVSLIRITSLNLLFSCLEEDPMPVLEKIPSLRDLELGTWAYGGEEMVCSDMGFPKLTRLTMSLLNNLEKWSVEAGSMPILSHLTISTCTKLEELPEGLQHLSSLRKLILRRSPKLCYRVRGPDFYKVAHVPNLIIH